jgi:hypothetical protein
MGNLLLVLKGEWPTRIALVLQGLAMAAVITDPHNPNAVLSEQMPNPICPR